MRGNSPALLVTCEHGGYDIPARYRQLFVGAEEILTSHRGWDRGALNLAQRLAKEFSAPLIAERRSRLLIELNRTSGHPRIFSEFSRKLAESERQKLFDEIYHPYRQRVIEELRAMMRRRPVIHISVHTFSPVLNEKTRKTDIGLLFDPARTFESRIAHRWRESLRVSRPDLQIHFNRPYRGTSDGLTTWLRTVFPDDGYAGIEIEVNQKFPSGDAHVWRRIQQEICRSLRSIATSNALRTSNALSNRKRPRK